MFETNYLDSVNSACPAAFTEPSPFGKGSMVVLTELTVLLSHRLICTEGREYATYN